MKSWNNFFKKNDGNSFPHQSLIVFFNRKFSKIKTKVDILDLGCGTGSTSMLIKKKNYYLDCVDISSIAINKFKNKNKNKNIKIFKSSFNNFLENSKKKYDLIIDSASLQHQSEYDLRLSYSLINKNLKKKGFFLSINLNSAKGLNDESFSVTKLNKNKLLKLFKLSKLKNIDYNYYIYTENNSKHFIKLNLISGQK